MKIFDVHLDKADKGAAKIRPFPAAAIDDHTDPGDFTAVRAHNIDGFLHPSAPRDDIFGHDELLAGRDLEAAPEHQAARFFLNENVAFSERTANFMPDDDSSEGRGNHGVALDSRAVCRRAARRLLPQWSVC